jgi:hypothetical protein
MPLPDHMLLRKQEQGQGGQAPQSTVAFSSSQLFNPASRSSTSATRTSSTGVRRREKKYRRHKKCSEAEDSSTHYYTSGSKSHDGCCCSCSASSFCPRASGGVVLGAGSAETTGTATSTSTACSCKKQEIVNPFLLSLKKLDERMLDQEEGDCWDVTLTAGAWSDGIRGDYCSVSEGTRSQVASKQSREPIAGVRKLLYPHSDAVARLVPCALSQAELGKLRLIGQGSWCSIYSCWFRGQEAAVKMPRKSLRGDHLFMVRNILKQELCILKALQEHPSIVRVLGSGVSDSGSPFIVMERLKMSLGQAVGTAIDENTQEPDGGVSFRRPGLLRSLFRVCSLVRRPKAHRRIKWIYQAALGLEYAHQFAEGFIIHRDVKPSNMGIDAKGDLKLFDFGLARLVPRGVAGCTEVYYLTGDAGSLRYMAPEVARREPYNESIDVYGWAMVAAEILNMQLPSKGYTVTQFVSRVVHGGERPPLPFSIPCELADLIRECWAADSSNRPSMQQVCQCLQEMKI